MGGLAFGLVPRAFGAPGDVPVYGLDPEWGASDPTCTGTCSACSACRCHAANKIFATAADADAGRAHPACKCLVVQLATIAPALYDALFVTGGSVPSVDRRSSETAATLAGAPSIPAPAGAGCGGRPASPILPGGGGGSGGGGGQGGDDPVRPGSNANGTTGGSQDPQKGCSNLRDVAVADGKVAARVVSTWVRGGRYAKRVVYASIEATETVEAIVTVRRGTSKVLAKRRFSCLRGRSIVRVAIPETAKAGPARVEVEFYDLAGDESVVTSPLRVPVRRTA